MAGEKNFENRLKKWLESEGIYPLGEPVDRMSAPPCGFYEKRFREGREGGRFREIIGSVGGEV